MKNSALTLNNPQQEAVEHIDGPLLVVAGAGAGKTRVVTSRIQALLEKGVPAHQILAVTFTNKAAAEMKERVMTAQRQHVLICTFHSLGTRILRESISFLGYRSDFVIYDDDDTDKLLKSCLLELNIKSKEMQPKVFKGMISHAKNRLTTPEEVNRSELVSPIERLFPDVYKLYQLKLKEYNALDFDDLLCLTVRLFQEHPEVLKLYQYRWRYLLIDEYQDTNHAQYMMAKLLVAHTHNIFVVGDPDQSIYSWRGANIENILNFERDYPRAKIVRLEQNYRSHSNILNAANALIKHNQQRHEKNLWSALGDGEKITINNCISDRQEADFVVDTICEHVENGELPLDEIVIFYRTNFQSRQFEDALLRRRLPYVIFGGLSFYQRREIKDILAYLRIIHSGTDFISFARTINLPKRGLGDTSLEKLRAGASAEQLPIFTYCEKLVRGEGAGKVPISAKQQESLKEYVDIINELRQKNGSVPLYELVTEIIRSSCYLQYLKEDAETYHDRKSNLDELISKAAEWEELYENSSLTNFLEDLSLKSTLDEEVSNQPRIHLMTLHNGKGLEFALTFLVGLEEGLFPHISAKDSIQELEEERRLCYVGMTRAKQHLYISWARFRYLWGTQQIMRPSRFLQEIPTKYVDASLAEEEE